jgi:hypothetical protein
LPAGASLLERLVATVEDLLHLVAGVAARGVDALAGLAFENAALVVAEARRIADELDLPSTRVRAEFAATAIEARAVDQLAIELPELLRHLRHDLRSCGIWPIPRTRTWALGLALEERTARVFPTSVQEVHEAGRCLAAGLPAAAVFHFLRAARPALRTLVAMTTSTGGRPASLESAAVAALQALVDEADRWPAGPAREGAVAFHAEMLAHVRILQDASERLSATRASLDEAYAAMVWQATRDLLTALAARAADVGARAIERESS